MDRLRPLSAPKVYMPTADRRGGKAELLREGILNVILGWKIRIEPGSYQKVNPRLVTSWTCRTAADVFAMHRYMKQRANVVGYAAVEAVYPPGCEWLAALSRIMEVGVC